MTCNEGNGCNSSTYPAAGTTPAGRAPNPENEESESAVAMW